jgi:PAS domain S-box-containing protein
LVKLTLTLGRAPFVARTGGEAFLLRLLNSVRAAARRLHTGGLTARAMPMTDAQGLDEPARNANAMAEKSERPQAAQAQIESDLRRATERCRIISEMVSDYAYVLHVTPGGFELEWGTEAFEHITGYTVMESESLGGWRHLIHPDDLPMAQQRTAALLAGQPDVSNVRIIAKDGRVHWLRDYSRPIVDRASGRVVEIVGTAQDITARKAAEDALAQLNRDLEQRISERTAQLTNANRALEADIAQRVAVEAALRTTLARQQELNDLKSRFIARTSHEFRTPLSTIYSAAQLLEQHNARFSSEKRNAYLQRIQVAVRQMVKLLEDILTVDKFTAGKTSCQPEPLDLPGVCAEWVEEVEMTEHTGRRVDMVIGEGVHMATMDAQLLKNVLQNVLSNALRYSPADSRVGFQIAVQDGEATFCITDHGPGIFEDEMAQLFEPFFRGRSGASADGSGLGMTIAQESARRHGGAIAVHSTVGAGTTVIVNIPVR